MPEFSDVDAADEFNHIKDWASKNKMILHFVKTKELVFHRPNPCNIVFPPAVDSIEQVRVAKLLGVYLQCNFAVRSMLSLFYLCAANEYIC